MYIHKIIGNYLQFKFVFKFNFNSNSSFQEYIWNLYIIWYDIHIYFKKFRYGKEVLPNGSPIPSHIYRAAGIGALSKLVKPYPNKPDVDVTEKLKELGWTQLKMFQSANKFFESLGLESVPEVRNLYIL